MNGVLSNAMTNTAQSSGLGTDTTRKTDRRRSLFSTDSVRHHDEHPGQARGTVRRRVVRRKRVRRRLTSSYRREDKPVVKRRQTAESAYEAKNARSSSKGTTLAWKSLRGKASLHRASIWYEQGQSEAPSPQSGASTQQQYMLNRLVRMVSISMAQHTGGDAGESYSRKDTRRIFSALSSLTASSKPADEDRSDKKADSRSEAYLKAKRAKVLGLLAVFEPDPVEPGYEPTELVA